MRRIVPVTKNVEIETDPVHGDSYCASDPRRWCGNLDIGMTRRWKCNAFHASLNHHSDTPLRCSACLAADTLCPSKCVSLDAKDGQCTKHNKKLKACNAYHGVHMKLKHCIGQEIMLSTEPDVPETPDPNDFDVGG